ncbi:efflux transporter outer membrane subunit [Roseateles chitinivorans]|uniref:efflux transporter outer membrane subunit n=1 Tax=Roseateles chitinivorans TaxID=2917965 RepID=UPI003D669B38
MKHSSLLLGAATLPLVAALTLCGCASPSTFSRPETATPSDWSQWRTGDAALPRPVTTTAATATATAAPAAGHGAGWWTTLNDPVLDELEGRAARASPDLRTAALHFAQARTQLQVVVSQRGPQAKASAGALRQRQSEYGASTRLLDVIGGSSGANRDQLVSALSSPFNDYQAGLDVSWELDLWGRVSQSIEAADADVATQVALLALARQSLAGQVAQHYLTLRSAQDQRQVVEEDVAGQQDRLDLLKARVDAGLIDHFDLERQRADLATTRAQLPALLDQLAQAQGQLELLLGEQPGALSAVLAPRRSTAGATALPDLSLGLPSEVARRRPDIRAAEAKLRKAVANVGIAQAELYPSIRIGAHAGLESYQAGKFTDWASRTWSIGPSLDLPIFDRGRRQRVVQLRELQQQEAAIDYQQTVVKSWHEIDDALNTYFSEREQLTEARLREAHLQDALDLVSARYGAGTVDVGSVLDVRRGLLQARRERVLSEGRLRQKYVQLHRATAAEVAVGDASDELPD